MAVITGSIELTTRGSAQMIDITSDTARIVGQTGLDSGTVTLFCPSATSALTTIEFEPGCLSDLARLFDEVADPARHYAHNARWGDGNGHSHVRAALLGASLTVPFVDGRLTLGTWQQIIYVDFDNRARQRRLVAQVMGE
jgi:secondary thiamine-phosphate synthase enzyme